MRAWVRILCSYALDLLFFFSVVGGPSNGHCLLAGLGMPQPNQTKISYYFVGRTNIVIVITSILGIKN